jgi:CheY-like chemotaxis protein
MKRFYTDNAPDLRDKPAQPRRRVLYIEDDPNNRQVAKLRLDKKYDIVFATNDREACEAFVQHGHDLSVILMDIELKGSMLNGIDLTLLVRGRLPPERRPSFAERVGVLDTPILFLSAYGMVHSRAELLKAGGDDLVDKPIDFVALHTTIARVYLQRLV